MSDADELPVMLTAAQAEALADLWNAVGFWACGPNGRGCRMSPAEAVAVRAALVRVEASGVDRDQLQPIPF